MKKLFISSALLLMALGVSAKDIKTVVLTTTPQMHCASCENKIKGKMRFEKGIKSIETNIPNQTVTIEYDADKTNVPAIIEGFKKIKYEAKEVGAEKGSAPSRAGTGPAPTSPKRNAQ